MSTVMNLAFVVKQATNGREVRKFVFENQDRSLRATLLGGDWGRKSVLNNGVRDGVAITAPFVLPLRPTETQHGTVLRPQGIGVKLEGATLEPVLDDHGRPVVGADGKPLSNLKGGRWVITTHTMSSGDVEDWAVASPNRDSDQADF